MVSALSARLLADRDGGSSFRSGSGNGSDGDRASSSGGYSAGSEGSRTASPPDQISMQMKHKRSSSDSNDRAKRRKHNEEQYAAYTAKEDMERGNVRIRPIEKEKSRIALGKVDMGRVTFLRSNELESSPFLLQSSLPGAHINYDFASESVYNALLDSCRHVYNLIEAVETDDSTSSFSETESNVSRDFAKDSVILKPRVDDALPSISLAKPCPTVIAEQDIASQPEVSMTMEAALTVCSFSRLMTLATSPYTVVHSNAACGHLTGLSSANIIGKPLYNSLGTAGIPSLASCAESSAAGNDVAFSVMSNDKKTIPCKMKVTPIVSSVHNAPKVTHYAVDFTAVGDETANEASLEAATQQSSADRGALATTVVG